MPPIVHLRGRGVTIHCAACASWFWRNSWCRAATTLTPVLPSWGRPSPASTSISSSAVLEHAGVSCRFPWRPPRGITRRVGACCVGCLWAWLESGRWFPGEGNFGVLKLKSPGQAATGREAIASVDAGAARACVRRSPARSLSSGKQGETGGPTAQPSSSRAP